MGRPGSAVKHQVRIPKGCGPPLVGINVAVGSALSVIPTQQDKVLPNSLGLVLFGDKFLFSQGVAYEETENRSQSGLEGSLGLSNECGSVVLLMANRNAEK